MGNVWLQGVVRDGRVVLDGPLNLPDGTAVIVTDCYELDDDPRPPEPSGPPPPEVVKEIMLGLARRPDLMNDPEWEQKIRRQRG